MHDLAVARDTRRAAGSIVDVADRRSGSAPRRRGPLGPGAVDPAQERVDPGDELPGAERLRHVVVGADAEPDDEVVLGVAGGEHEHRDRPVGLDALAHLEAVEAGEHEVEHDEIGVQLGARSTPAGPSAAISTANPSERSRAATAAAIVASSSMTRIVRAEGASAAAEAIASG